MSLSSAICAISYAWEAVVIGMVGGQLAVLTPIFLNWMKIDDPVGVIPVHFVCSMWGMISVGLFVDEVSHSLLDQFRIALNPRLLNFNSTLYFRLSIMTVEIN